MCENDSSIGKVPEECVGFNTAEQNGKYKVEDHAVGYSSANSCANCGLLVRVTATAKGTKTSFDYEKFDEHCNDQNIKKADVISPLTPDVT